MILLSRPFFSYLGSQSRPALIRSSLRVVTLAVLVVAVLGASGCRWFRKDDPYAENAESRPLELPPEFNAQEAEAIYNGTANTGSVTRSSVGSGGAPIAQGLGFTVSGDRSAVFERVGTALAKIEGANVISRAQLLNAYDIDFEGSKFLVRISEVAGGSQVAAVDPRGLPAQGAAPTKLIAALKAALEAK
jgi:uncharacterized lipoprotein